MNMRRIKIGDIVEIKTKTGFFYAQCTHKIKDYGELIQVTNSSFKERPVVDEILACKVGIITFFPLNLALKEIEFELIGNSSIPKPRERMPVFRVRGDVDKNGNVKGWCFWDGEKYWPNHYIKELTSEEQRLPIRGCWNKALLLQRLEEGWLPEMYGCIT